MLKAILETVARGLGGLHAGQDDVRLDIRPRLQLDDYSCGLQSLASILDYYDYAVDLDELADDIGLTEDGCDEDQIRRAIRAYGLKHRSMSRMSLAKIQQCIDDGEPILVAPNNGHWSVLYGYGEDSVYIMDPRVKQTFGRAGKNNLEQFLGSWNKWGIAVYE